MAIFKEDGSLDVKYINSVPEKKVKVTFESWKNSPVSSKYGTLVLHQHITDKNMEVIRMGHIPEVQEDHWFIWCNDSHIRICRSWTGACMFEAEYAKEADGDGYVIGEVKVNLDRDEMDFAFGPEASCALFMCLIRAEIASQWQSQYAAAGNPFWEKFIRLVEENR